MKAATSHQGGETIVYDPEIIDQVEDLSFDPAVLKQRGVVSGIAAGRDGSEALFFTYKQHKLIAKHYRRGGLFAPLLGDSYLWLGQARSRPQGEWELLVKMRELGLPVPRPVACRVQRKGLSYRGDMVMQQLEDCQTVAQLLQQDVLDESVWRAIGGLIRRFHAAGVYHADLNANNIMRDTAGTLFVIDFDKGRLRDRRGSWQRDNLLRLRRSLDKLSGLHRPFHYRDSDWRFVQDGYSSGHSATT